MLEIGLILTVQDATGSIETLRWKMFVPHQRKLRLLITSQDKALPGILLHLFSQAGSRTSDSVMVKGSIWFRMKHAASSFSC